MDIAKIRKKAREQGQERQSLERPEEAETCLSPPDEPGDRSAGQDIAPAAGPAESEAAGAQEKAASAPEETSGPPCEPPPAAPGPSVDAGEPAGEGGAGSASDALMSELLTFSLANEEFAFRVSEVEEIIKFQRITVLPAVQDYVAGITSLRGKIIPVIDLRTRLSLKTAGGEDNSRLPAGQDGEADGKGKIIILSGPLGLIGVIIDKVIGVVRLPEDVILEPPGHLTEEETKFIEGVVIVDKRFISIIRSEDALNIEVS